MKAEDYYSCVMRIDVGSADPATIDAELQLNGEHSHVVRRARRNLRALDFNRWQYPACDSGGHDDWESLEDALATHVIKFPAAHATLTCLGASEKAWWWCGCFHDNSPSLVYLSADLIAKLALVGVPLYLDNYSPSSESPFATVEPDEGQLIGGSVEFYHSYRFWMSREGMSAVQYASESAINEAAPVWHDFADGLQDLLDRRLGDQSRMAGHVVVCEHRQFAFDGGPAFHQTHLRELARLGLGIAVVWTL
jgi:hypothetical protein